MKVGDRVVVTKGQYLITRPGSIGIVENKDIHDPYPIFVKFDSPIDEMYSIREEDLQVISNNTSKEKIKNMTKKEYLEFHKACCDKMTDITAKKNADYTGEGDDPFANFSRVEALGIATTEQGFLTRMLDKMCRITTFSQKGVLLVADESIEDTLLDLANYSILLAGYIKSKKQSVKGDK